MWSSVSKRTRNYRRHSPSSQREDDQPRAPRAGRKQSGLPPPAPASCWPTTLSRAVQRAEPNEQQGHSPAELPLPSHPRIYRDENTPHGVVCTNRGTASYPLSISPTPAIQSIYADFFALASAACAGDHQLGLPQEDGRTHLHDPAPLLLQQHNLKPLEIARAPPLLNRLAADRPGTLLPLGENVRSGEDLGDRRRSGRAGELGEDEGGEHEAAVGEGLAGDAGEGAFDEGLQGEGIEGQCLRCRGSGCSQWGVVGRWLKRCG